MTENRQGQIVGEGVDVIQSFYEAHPYPPPVESLSRRSVVDPEQRRASSLILWPLQKPKPARRILVAGCGTSQAARYAFAEPDAEVVGIDVSDTALRHTRALQRKHELGNLSLRQLAIEEAGELGKTFDQIVCTGVLHHLADPDAGLAALRAVLALDGALQLMVYAPYGRAGVYLMQAYCRLLDVGASRKDLADLAAVVAALGPDHPVTRLVKRVKDFGQPDALADALLNPRDRAFSVPQLFDWLSRCGLVFGRWQEQAPYLPQSGSAAPKPHAARLAALAEPDCYAAMELLRGTMDKHACVAYRDDRSAAPQPISFEGDGWRDYVPVGLPWSRLVRDGAPRGFSAALINPNHAFVDLALLIGRSEERLLAAIDGVRSIGAILADVGDAVGGEEGRVFFQRLWEHDQIVFDSL
jgi:SAM-dependent methyltransferase